MRMGFARRRLTPEAFVLAATMLAATMLAACGGGGSTDVPVAPAPTPTPVGVHGLTVLFPPTAPAQAYYRDVQTYLVNNSAAPVDGANFSVSWAAVDKGPGANPQYDWSPVDNVIQPWIAAGKKAYLTVWGNGYGTGTQTLAQTPAYVKAQVSIINCQGSAPAYWQNGYKQHYKEFIAALLQRYGGSTDIGYVRFGLGIGGEATVVFGFSALDCQAQLTAAGFTKDVWLAYLGEMLAYQKSLGAKVQLMTTTNVPNSNNPDYSIPDSIAAFAVRSGIGFGSQGLQQSDITAFNAGKPCGVNWCANFQRFVGKVPLELQTIAASDPTGAGTGSLADLLPFGLQLGARNFEVYWADWLIAYDPGYPGYAQYHVAYQQALAAVVAAFGKSP